MSCLSYRTFDLDERLLTLPQDAYNQEANTPRKSKKSVEQSCYLDVAETPFPTRCLNRMKDTVGKVLEKAQRNDFRNAHQYQWGQVVSQLLCEVEIWQEGPAEIVVLNV